MEVLAEGAACLGICLEGEQVERFRSYYDELTVWNATVNLTAVSGCDEVQTRHFLDSLAVASALPATVLDGSERLLDVGTGAGFPGLPLKLAYPRIDLALLEATAKKTAFLRHVVDKLGLEGVDVVTGRAEEEGAQAGDEGTVRGGSFEGRGAARRAGGTVSAVLRGGWGDDRAKGSAGRGRTSPSPKRHRHRWAAGPKIVVCWLHRRSVSGRSW